MLMLVLFTVMVPLLLSGCSQVEVKDEIFYGNKGMHGAVAFHTLTPDKREITFEEWMKLLKEKPLVCSSVEAFGDYKGVVEKLCSICNCCTYETKAAFDRFFANVQGVADVKSSADKKSH